MQILSRAATIVALCVGAVVAARAVTQDPPPPGAATSAEVPRVFQDDRFGFRLERPDSAHWRFRGAGDRETPLRVQLQHAIGGKLDPILVQVYAWESKNVRVPERTHLERFAQTFRKQHDELTGERSREKDRFGRYRTRSYTASGRSKRDPTRIQRVTIHVFKERKTLYTVLLLREPRADEKYAKAFQEIERGFRAR